MDKDLKILANNREPLLVAEMGAWLHDMGKCTDEMITLQASDKPKDFKYKYKTKYLYLLDDNLITLFGEKINLKDLIEKSKPQIVKETNKPWLIRTLGRVHGAAHIEKEEPFGQEKKEIQNKIQNKEKEQLENEINKLKTQKQSLEKNLLKLNLIQD